MKRVDLLQFHLTVGSNVRLYNVHRYSKFRLIGFSAQYNVHCILVLELGL